MNFQFESIDAFLSMKGHGPYVWACYVITFSVLIALIASPLMQRKTFLRQQKKIAVLQKKHSDLNLF